MTMNPEIKAEWVKRLRSGDYEQGRNYLNNDGKFCCLGVLCEVGVDEGSLVREVKGSVTHYRPTKQGYSVALIAESTILPFPFAKEIGVSPVPGVNRVPLTELNDFERKTFSEIADLIEEHL